MSTHKYAGNIFALGVAVALLAGCGSSGTTTNSNGNQRAASTLSRAYEGSPPADPASATNAPCVYSATEWVQYLTANPSPSWLHTPVLVGDVQAYSAGNLLDLLKADPKGDQSLDLAHQLVAAKLNYQYNYYGRTNLAYASPEWPADVESARAAADAWIAIGHRNYFSTGSAKGFGVTGNPDLTAWTATLASYNTGAAIAQCSAMPTKVTYECATLGPAAGKSVFLLHGFTGHANQVDGSLVAGGNVTLDAFAVGPLLDSSSNPVALITTGQLTLWNGQINGQVRVPASMPPDLLDPVLVDGDGKPVATGTITGQVTAGTPWLDITATNGMQQTLSLYLRTFADSATFAKSTNDYKNLVLTSNTTDKFTVFNVDATTFSEAQSIDIQAPPGTTVVVNVSGPAVTFPTAGIFNVDPSNIIWHFPYAYDVYMSKIDVIGTVLAPWATVHQSNSQVRGAILADSYTNGSDSASGGIRMAPFTGCIPASWP